MVPPISHPLYFHLRWLSQATLWCVTSVADPVFGTTFRDDYRRMSTKTRGSRIGSDFELKLFYWLDHLQPGHWRLGVGPEPDIVCVHNPDWSFEVKTSCASGNAISGNRVQATADKPPSFLLYVNYHRDTLTVRDVRLGWCGPSDWVAGGETSQSARMSREGRAAFVKLPAVQY